jgi:hypothetical protein
LVVLEAGGEAAAAPSVSGAVAALRDCAASCALLARDENAIAVATAIATIKREKSIRTPIRC